MRLDVRLLRHDVLIDQHLLIRWHAAGVSALADGGGYAVAGVLEELFVRVVPGVAAGGGVRRASRPRRVLGGAGRRLVATRVIPRFASLLIAVCAR